MAKLTPFSQPAEEPWSDPIKSYNPAHYQELFAVEEKHFWFVARNRIIVHFIKDITRHLQSDYRLLEIGCGTGNVLRALEASCPDAQIIGMDLFGEGLQFARKRSSCPLVRADICSPPFEQVFDVIGLFDVIEHLPDDIAALTAVSRLLKPQGKLFVTVPAHPQLWSYFDVSACHCRRYTIADLEKKLDSAGYRIEYATQFMAVLYPLMRLFRKITERKIDKPDLKKSQNSSAGDLRIVPVLNNILLHLIALERPLLSQRRRLPLGTSLLAIASPK